MAVPIIPLLCVVVGVQYNCHIMAHLIPGGGSVVPHPAEEWSTVFCFHIFHIHDEIYLQISGHIGNYENLRPTLYRYA